jgi:hypothetical protein
LSFKCHQEQKLVTAKLAVNSAWENVYNNNFVPLRTKNEVFSSTARTVLRYASEIWGFKQYEEVEKSLRFYIKKIFMLSYRGWEG